MPTFIEVVKWFLMFSMLEMVFDYVNVLLMIAYKRFLFDAQCDDRGLVIASFLWKMRKTTVRLLSFVIYKQHIRKLLISLNEGVLYHEFTFFSDSQDLLWLVQCHYVLISLCFAREKLAAFSLTTHLFDYLLHNEERLLRLFFYIKTAWWILPLYNSETSCIFWFKPIQKHIAVCSWSRVFQRLCEIQMADSRRRHFVPPLPTARVRYHALIHTWMSWCILSIDLRFSLH